MNFSYKNQTAQVKRYSTIPEVVEAVLVTESNLDAVAKWCGGEVDRETKPSDHTDIYSYVKVPTLRGPLKAGVGTYVVRNTESGRFSIIDQPSFQAKGFHEVGLRQDGPFPRAAGTITRSPGPIAINSGEAYGEYADPRYQTQDQTTQPAVARAVDEYLGRPRDVLDMS